MKYFSLRTLNKESRVELEGEGTYYLPQSIYRLLEDRGVKGVDGGYLGWLHYFNKNGEDIRPIFRSKLVTDVLGEETVTPPNPYQEELDTILGDIIFDIEEGEYDLDKEELDYLKIITGDIGIDLVSIPYEYYKDNE